MSNEAEIIQQLINCLETSNKLLSTYQGEQVPGEKQEIIRMCINNNALCVITALEIEGEEGVVEEGVGTFFVATRVEDFNEVIFKLKQIRHDLEKEKHIDYFKLDDAIKILEVEPETEEPKDFKLN